MSVKQNNTFEIAVLQLPLSFVDSKNISFIFELLHKCLAFLDGDNLVSGEKFCFRMEKLSLTKKKCGSLKEK